LKALEWPEDPKSTKQAAQPCRREFFGEGAKGIITISVEVGCDLQGA
jgi:hypothetical protein